MKVKLKSLFILIFLSFSGWMTGKYIIGKTLSANSTKIKPRIFLESLSFNHDTECNTCDAINIRKNFHEDVHIPEWKRGEKSYPAAYIKNKCVTVKAIFTADLGIEKAIIRAERSAGDLGNLEQAIVFFESGTSKPVYFRVLGKTPSEIKSFIQEWNWYYSDINCNGSGKVHIGRSRNEIFIVLSEPQAPWTTTGNSKPWVDVLEKSCCWANKETSPEGAAGKITQNIYDKLGGTYKLTPTYTNSQEGGFALNNFLKKIPCIGEVNCYDMGKSLVIFSNAVGCDLRYRHSEPFGVLKPHIEMIGGVRIKDKIGNHTFASLGDNVFDATYKRRSTDAHKGWFINTSWSIYKEEIVYNASSGYPKDSQIGGIEKKGEDKGNRLSLIHI